MEIDYNREHWETPCPRVKCSKPTVGLVFISVPASVGDDREGSPVAPTNGAYCNAIVRYEANGAVYIYSAEGVPVNVKEGVNATA